MLLLTNACLILAAASSVTVHAGQCGQSSQNHTLASLSPENVDMVAAANSDDCCAACLARPNCATWSFQHKWTPETPCHLSPYAIISTSPAVGDSCGIARTPAPLPPGPAPPPPPGPLTPGVFVIDTSAAGRRQVFEGVQVELMSDSIGSDNQGMPGDGRLVPDDDNTTLGVPHDLAPSERLRFASEVMRGVRTIRLALGLYLRGLGPDNRSIVGRWPSQMTELKQLQDLSGIEGWAPEYWSPPPGWKDSQSYYSGTLASFNDTFLDVFSDGVINDIKYLQQAGLKVVWWGLQNEPGSGGVENKTCPHNPNTKEEAAVPNPLTAGSGANTYARCDYSQCNYYTAFVACAKKVRALDPSIRIHVNSQTGQIAGAPIALDPATLPLVDAWTHHTVNNPSTSTFGNKTLWAYGKLDFTNEMEYQPGSPYAGSKVGTVSAANSFLNTLTFKNSPTGVIILHACKPTTNLESLGYGWTWWRSTGTPPSPSFPSLESNHFDYNYWNWNTVAPFVKTVPWNSVRVNVMEDTQRTYQRVVAFVTPESGTGGPLHGATPAGKLIVCLTNEFHGKNATKDDSFSVTVGTTDGTTRVWQGYSFEGGDTGVGFNVSLGAPIHAPSFQTVVAANTIQWWYEQ